MTSFNEYGRYGVRVMVLSIGYANGATFASSRIGIIFLIFQALMLSKGAKEQLSDWVFNKPGATIDTPEALDAATTLVKWTEAGYLPSDVNAINNTEAVA